MAPHRAAARGFTSRAWPVAPAPSPCVSTGRAAGAVRATHGRRQVLLPAFWRARGLAQVMRLDTGEVHVCLQAAGGRGCRQACAGCARARVRVRTMSLHCVLTPHLRQEGPLSETIDLPTCHAFAKTKISKDTSSFSGGARARGSPPGGTDPLSFSVARS